MAGPQIIGPTSHYYYSQRLKLQYVDWGNPGKPQKRIRAMVAPAPYKKDNRRADLASVAAPAR